MSSPMLAVDGLTKRYAETVLDRVTLDLFPGEIHALLGANGAGKSTLCKIVAGLLAPTSGRMQLDGSPYGPTGKQSAEMAGVQIVQQALDRLKIRDIATDTTAGELGVGHQQMIEIAAAIDRDCKILILDEPTAALSAGESETLFETLQQLREQGIGMFYISHRLHEVEQLSDRVSVLRDGKLICSHSTASVTPQQMVDLMTGDTEKTQQKHTFVSFASGKSALRVESVTRGDTVRNVSFHVDCGERLGIAGLVGAGRTELLRLIFGADRGDSGQLFIGNDAIGRPLFSHPRAAVAAGLAMITEDRKDNGLLLSQSVRVNASLTALRTQFSSCGLIRNQDEGESVESIVKRFDTRCEGIEQPVGMLSGGNQQKVAISKWLLSEYQVFLFDEPTRGIDVAARWRIYELMESLVKDGKALVIVSSDMDELMENCDRILVLSGGRLTEAFQRGEWTEERLMQAAFAGLTQN